MTTSKKKSWVISALAAVVVLGAGLWYFTSGSSLPVLSAAPTYTLENLDGKKVTSDDFKGKVRLVEFMYTNCPDICPMTTANMVQLQKMLKEEDMFGKDVQFVSVTFDPKRDTPDVLKAYQETMGIDSSGWTFLRGDEQEVAKLMEQFGAYVEKQPDGSFAHTIT
ncbi:MAG: SCO family protein, partial [Tumebacillaceae bacterium]